MSVTAFSQTGHKITTASLRDHKLRHEPISCLTAYDYSAARIVDEAGVEMVLVGDSLAQTVLGYENTLCVTMDEMLHHVKAVRRGVKSALLMADMPFASYQIDPLDAVRNAARFVKEAGAEVVKIEGGEKRVDLIRRIINAEIPSEVGTPTIGIGAGPECDGRVPVFHDILNLTFGRPAKFVRRYGDAAALMTAAVQSFRADVKSHQYPSDEESYHLPKETKANLDSLLANPPTRYSSWQVLPTRKVNGNGDHIAAD